MSWCWGGQGEACRVPLGAAGGCWHLGSSRQVPKFASPSQSGGTDSSPSLSSPPGAAERGRFPPPGWRSIPGAGPCRVPPLPWPARSRVRGCRRPRVLARPQRTQTRSAPAGRSPPCVLPLPGLSSLKLLWKCFGEWSALRRGCSSRSARAALPAGHGCWLCAPASMTVCKSCITGAQDTSKTYLLSEVLLKSNDTPKLCAYYEIRCCGWKQCCLI